MRRLSTVLVLALMAMVWSGASNGTLPRYRSGASVQRNTSFVPGFLVLPEARSSTFRPSVPRTSTDV